MSPSIGYSFKEPPAFPIIKLEIANATEEKYVPKVGKIDTGAFMTVIPDSLKNDLNIKTASSVKAGGFDTEAIDNITYFVYVKINSTKFGLLEIMSKPDRLRPNVLVGRDLINLWKMTLDGENKLGTFDVWSTDLKDA